MNKFSELAAAITARIAARNNPTNLKAADVGAYTTEELAGKYDTLIPISTLGISQVGDQSYFPLAIDGSADGAIAMTDRRTYGICRESDGSAVILRSATNSMADGVYYAICKTDNTDKILSAVGTSRQYKPAALSKIPQSIWAHNTGVMFGLALDANNANPQLFCTLTNGTFDVSRHVSCLVTGDLNYATYGMYVVRATTVILNGVVYLFIYSTAGGQHKFDVFRANVSSFVNGGNVAFTKVTGISGKLLEGTAVSGGTSIALWNNLMSNNPPAQVLTAIPYRAAMRMFAVGSGNVIRILFGTAWYINTTANKAKDGLSNFCIDFNVSTLAYTWATGSGQASYVERTDGEVVISGPNSKVRGDSDYNDGYWQMSSGNNTGNMHMRDDGLITCCVNDNLASPMVLSFRVNGFAGNAFSEIGKVIPTQGYTQTSGWISIEDRVVGATAAHGFVSFLSKTKVWLLSRTPGAQGNFEARIINNKWDLTNVYKNSVVDVTGFPPSNDVKVLGSVASIPNFLTVHMSDDVSVSSASYLMESRTATKVDINPDTFEVSGADISMTYAEQLRAAKLCWDTYQGTKITYDTYRASICIPPASTGAPVLMFATMYNTTTQQHAMLVSEVTVSGRSGVVTVTGVVSAVAYSVQSNIIGFATIGNGWGSLSYRKCSDGWLIAGASPYRQQTAGNANGFQLRAAKKADGSWAGVVLDYLYAYLAQSGQRWNIHPVWGIGYVDLAVANQLSQGGSIFNAYGATVAEYLAGVIKTKYMVSTIIAAAGFNLYVNEPIPVMMAGMSHTLPTQRLNLQDIDSSAGNSTWYISIVLNNGVVSLSASKTKQADDPVSRINIGTVVTSATQITTMALVKTTMLLTKIIG